MIRDGRGVGFRQRDDSPIHKVSDLQMTNGTASTYS